MSWRDGRPERQEEPQPQVSIRPDQQQRAGFFSRLVEAISSRTAPPTSSSSSSSSSSSTSSTSSSSSSSTTFHWLRTLVSSVVVGRDWTDSGGRSSSPSTTGSSASRSLGAAAAAAASSAASAASAASARMGNCLKSPTADDVSLLREAPPNPGGGLAAEMPEDHPLSQSPSSYHHHHRHHQEDANAPVYYPSPNVGRPASQLTEEEQVKIAQRMGLIQHLPTGSYDGCKKNRECVICMIEFVVGDRVRYLPCMHTYHTECIDDWLMRSFTCPSCMEPVDAALLVTYETH